MNEDAYKTYGRELKNLGSMTDNDNIDDYGPFGNVNGPNHYNGEVHWDEGSIINYWQFRAKSGDQFSVEMNQKILSHTGQYAKPVLAVEVGQLAYGIWKACNSRVLKQQNNKQSLNDQGIDLAKDYPIDSKVQNLKLKLTGFKNEYKQAYTRWGQGTYNHLIYGLDEKTGIKFKVKLGTKDVAGGMLMRLFNREMHGQENTFDLEKVDPIIITVLGKVKNISPEYKTVSLNYAVVTSPTEEEINAIGEKLKAEKATKTAKAENEKAERAVRIDEIKNNSSKAREELYRNLSEEEKQKFEENYSK